MQHVTYGISLINYYGKKLCQPYSTCDPHVCTSLAPRPMTVVFGLEMKLCVRMCTTLEKGVLCNRQQQGRAENSFIDQNEFVAMKTQSGCNSPHCDKCQFRDKIT